MSQEQRWELNQHCDSTLSVRVQANIYPVLTTCQLLFERFSGFWLFAKVTQLPRDGVRMLQVARLQIQVPPTRTLPAIPMQGILRNTHIQLCVRKHSPSLVEISVANNQNHCKMSLCAKDATILCTAKNLKRLLLKTGLTDLFTDHKKLGVEGNAVSEQNSWRP